jgi:dipeptidase
MCDCVVARGAATASGTTLFGKNSDREADEAQPLRLLPAAEHPRGARVRCSSLEIPQARTTAGVLGSGPFWCWGLEHGVNEHGVAIGNESVFTHEELELPETGLLGMDLVRLGLERAHSAREALEVICEHVERFGQGGPGFLHKQLAYSSGFLIADPDEAWSLQTSSRRWAARRLPEIGALSNQPSIGSDWERCSADAERYAIERGWWSAERGRLDFEQAYRSTRLVIPVFSEARLHRSLSLLERGRGDLDPPALIALLRDHGEGTPVPASVGKRDAAYYTLCAHNAVQGDTTASLVTDLGRRTRWLALAAPCTSVYLPLWLEGKVPSILLRGARDASADSAWWRFKRLQQATEADFAARLPRVRGAFDPLEEEWLGWPDAPEDPTLRMEEAVARALETCDALVRQLEG